MKLTATMIYRGESGIETDSREVTLPSFPVFASYAAAKILPLFDSEEEFYNFDNAACVRPGKAWVYTGVERETGEPIVITLFA